MVADEDERFMADGADYEVVMSEREHHDDYSGEAPATGDSTPYVRTKVWAGRASSNQDAADLAWAEWRTEYGEPTGMTATNVNRL